MANSKISALTSATTPLAGTEVLPIVQSGTTKQVSVANLTFGPAFSAYANATISMTNSTWTKVTFQVEEFDTNSNSDSATNYRFTPTVAGYYQISGGTTFQPVGAGNCFLAVYKNGSVFKYFGVLSHAAINYTQMYGSCLIYFNGSTDYVELYALQNSGGTLVNSASQSETYFQGIFVRGSS